MLKFIIGTNSFDRFKKKKKENIHSSRLLTAVNPWISMDNGMDSHAIRCRITLKIYHVCRMPASLYPEATIAWVISKYSIWWLYWGFVFGFFAFYLLSKVFDNGQESITVAAKSCMAFFTHTVAAWSCMRSSEKIPIIVSLYKYQTVGDKRGADWLQCFAHSNNKYLLFWLVNLDRL